MPAQDQDNSSANNHPPAYRIPHRVNVQANGTTESDNDDDSWSDGSSIEDGATDHDEDGNTPRGLASSSGFRQHNLPERNRDRTRHPDSRNPGSRRTLEIAGSRHIGHGKHPDQPFYDTPRPEPSWSTVATNYYPGEHVVPFYNANNPFKPTPPSNMPPSTHSSHGPPPYLGPHPGPNMYPGSSYPGSSYPGMMPPPLSPMGTGASMYSGPLPHQQYAPPDNFHPPPSTIRPNRYPPPYPGYPNLNVDVRREPDPGSSSSPRRHRGVSIRPPPERPPAKDDRDHANTRRRSHDYLQQVPRAQRQGGRPPGNRSATSRRVAEAVYEYDEPSRLSEERLQQAQAEIEAMEEVEKTKRKEMLEEETRKKALDEKEKELARREKLLEKKSEEEEREKLIQNTVERELRRRSAASTHGVPVPRSAPVGVNPDNALRKEIHETQRMIEDLSRSLQSGLSMRPGGGHLGHYFPPSPADYYPDELIPVRGPYHMDHPRYPAPRYPPTDYRTAHKLQQVMKRLERLEHNIATQPDLNGYYREDERLVAEYDDEPLDAGPEDDMAQLQILKRQIAHIEARQLGSSHTPKHLHEGQGEVESLYSTDEAHSDIHSTGKRPLARIRVTGREQQGPANPASPATPGIMRGAAPRPNSRASSGRAAHSVDVPDEDDTRHYTHKSAAPTRGAMNTKATRSGVSPSNRQDGYDSGREAESRGLKRTPMPYGMTGMHVRESRLEKFAPPAVPDAPPRAHPRD